MDDYITQFEELKKHMVVQNPNPSELYFVNSFLSGLKDEISSTLYLHKPLTLKDARDKARAHECVIEAMEKREKGNNKNFTPGSLFAKGGGSSNAERAKIVGNSQTGAPVKRLSYTDFKDKMTRGLSIYCDEKYSSGHKCTNKQLFLLMNEGALEESKEQAELSVIWEEENSTEEVEITETEVSIHALNGTQGLHTLDVLRKKEGKQLTILIESGSTHNFISPGMVKVLGVTTHPCSPFNVAVANGAQLSCEQQICDFE